MSKKHSTVDLAWIRNLHELGAPVREEAIRIRRSLRGAEERLKEAQRAHAAALRGADQAARKLEERIRIDWSREEIDAAKRGFTWVCGIEYPGPGPELE